MLAAGRIGLYPGALVDEQATEAQGKPCPPLVELRPLSVYFIYRSHYEGPAGKYVRRVDADTVLAWFQATWEPAQAANEP